MDYTTGLPRLMNNGVGTAFGLMALKKDMI